MPATTPLGSLSAADQARLDAIGPIWGTDIPKHRDIVLATYAPLLREAPREGVAVARDLAYGAHPRQRLDVFSPDGARNADTLVFVHGGAFIRGDKNVTGEVYDNVLLWLARKGCVGINIEYRLAPEAPFPAGAEDVAAAVRWTRENVARYGGNRDRIFVAGHSAGGAHVATYAFDPNVRAKPGPEVAGLVLLSARVRADVRPDNPNANGVRAYWGDDPARYDERSPVTWAGECRLPVMIAIAEHENPYLDVYCAELFHRLSVARKRSPRFLRLARHNHISLVAHFDSGEETLGPEILEFMARGA